MNSRDEFQHKLRAAFLVEAREHLQAASNGLLAMEQPAPGDGGGPALDECFRRVHSLKGAARATGYRGIEACCQRLEDVFAICRRQQRMPARAAFDLLHRALDHIGALLELEPGGSSAQTDALLPLLQALAAALRDEPATAPEPTPAPVVEAGAAAAATPRTGGESTLRVAAARLDQLLLATEDLLALKQTAQLRSAQLSQYEQGFERWRQQWSGIHALARRLCRETAPSLADAAAPDTDGPQRRLQEGLESSQDGLRQLGLQLRNLQRAAEREQWAVGKQIDELMDAARGLLMLPFSHLGVGLPKLVRDLARDQEKAVNLRLEGEDVILDKRVLERLRDPLLHLLRNAIDHGIETPAARQIAGKPEQATVQVRVRLGEGGRIELQVADDGAGIDLERVRRSAVARGLLEPDAVRVLPPEQVLELLFAAEFSTSAIITEISGRGLGLAIVREQIEALGGRVEIDNHPGRGVAFRIDLPQRLAAFRGVLVRVGERVFVLPSTHVERVVRLPPGSVKMVEGRSTVALADQAIALVSLAQVLALSADPASAEGWLTVVILGQAAQRVAFAVDAVLGDEEVLVRPLRPPLCRVRHIAGATVLASGDILPVLRAADLLQSARHHGQAAPAAADGADRRASVPAERGRVLLAEDSFTTRMLLKSVLESAGCQVSSAGDGIEAWTALRSEDFDLLVSDVEMPRLDGFALTARIRADSKLAALPVVLVTALASREDRERGIEVGANAYLTKSGFDQRELISAVKRLLAVRSRT